MQLRRQDAPALPGHTPSPRSSVAEAGSFSGNRCDPRPSGRSPPRSLALGEASELPAFAQHLKAVGRRGDLPGEQPSLPRVSWAHSLSSEIPRDRTLLRHLAFLTTSPFPPPRAPPSPGPSLTRCRVRAARCQAPAAPCATTEVLSSSCRLCPRPRRFGLRSNPPPKTLRRVQRWLTCREAPSRRRSISKVQGLLRIAKPQT